MAIEARLLVSFLVGTLATALVRCALGAYAFCWAQEALAWIVPV